MGTHPRTSRAKSCETERARRACSRCYVETYWDRDHARCRPSSLTLHSPNPRNSSDQRRTPDQLGGWSPEYPAARVGMTSREFPMRALSVLSLIASTLAFCNPALMTSTAPFTRLSSSLMPNETAICWPTIELLLRSGAASATRHRSGCSRAGPC